MIIDNNKIYYELRKFRYEDKNDLQRQVNDYSSCRSIRRILFMENAMPDETDIFFHYWSNILFELIRD